MNIMKETKKLGKREEEERRKRGDEI